MPPISSGDMEILRGFRTDGSRKILSPHGYFVSVAPREEVFSGQVDFIYEDNQNFAIAVITYDNESGDPNDVLPHMTVDFGTTPGANDVGQIRLRRIETAFDLLHLAETAPGSIPVEVGHYFSIKREWRPWLRLPKGVAVRGIQGYIDSIVMFVDYGETYIDQNEDLVPKANITRSATSRFTPKPAGFVDSYLTSSPETYRTMVLSSAFSFCLDDSIDLVDWDVQDGTITDGNVNSTTIEVQFPVGFRWISLTVVAANGKSGVMYFPIWVHDHSYMPLQRAHKVRDFTGDWREMELEFFQQNTSETVIEKGTAIACWENDPFWGETVPDAYRDQFLGWSPEDTTLFQKYNSRNVLSVTGLGEWLNRYRAIPMRVYDPGTTPETWFEMQNIYNDKLAFYLLENFTTANLLGNLHLSGNTDRLKSLDLTGNSILGQVQYAVLGYQGRARTDSLNAMWIRKHYSYLTIAERNAIDPVFGLTQADRLNDSPLRLRRRYSPPVASVLGAGASYNGTTSTIYNSRAPGRTPYDSNSEQDAPGLNLPTTDAQEVLNWMTGQHIGVLNNPNDSVPYNSLANLDAIEVAWGEPITVSDILPDSGLVVNDEEFLIKEINLIYENPYEGRGKRVEFALTEVTTQLPGQYVEVVEDTTQPPDYQPPQDISPVPTQPPPNYMNPNAGTDRIWLLGEGGVVYTSNWTALLPDWTINAFTLDGSEVIWDGIASPFVSTILAVATNTKMRVYNTFIQSPTLVHQHAFTYATQTNTRRTIQWERASGNENWIPCVYWRASGSGGGLIYEGSITGGATMQTATLIGTATTVPTGVGNGHIAGEQWQPALYVDPHTPGTAYVVARHTDGVYRLFKTTDFGATWSVTSDYVINLSSANVSYAWWIERPYLDTSYIYLLQFHQGAASQMSALYKATTSAAAIHFSASLLCGSQPYAGSQLRRGTRTCDSDPNKLVILPHFHNFGNCFSPVPGIQKSLNGSTVTEVVSRANYPSGAFWNGTVVGGDGKAVYLWGNRTSGTNPIPIGYVADMDTWASVSDVELKHGTGFPSGIGQMLNLGGW